MIRFVQRVGGAVRRAILLALVALSVPSVATAVAPSNDDCLACHGEKGIEAVTPRGKSLALHVDPGTFVGSAHEGFACVDCHTGAKSFDEVPHAPKGMTLACATCHAEEARSYAEKDVHGRARAAGDVRAASCGQCHGGHRILPLRMPESSMSALNEPDTCGRCHGSEEMNLREGITKRNLISRYKTSVHWQALLEGKNAATCSSCHSAHAIDSSEAFQSTISRTGIVGTCRKCHPNEARTFSEGAHGVPLFRGNFDVPTCVTCHGDHDMTSLRTRSGDARNWAATQVCIWCHGNERMMKRYALDTTPVESYMKDFHGLTQRGTLGGSATCADCHDAHHSLPSTHPKSRMSLGNRGTACSRCHGQVSKNFIGSFSHKTAAQASTFWVETLVRNVYIVLIVATIGGMLLHNFLQWLWAVRRKLTVERRAPVVRRMTKFEIVLHLVLFVSFTILAVTGFALKLPEAFWVRALFKLGVTEAVRAWIHRAAAVAMTIDFVVLGAYLVTRPRGRCILKALLPSLADVRNFFETVAYYRGKRSERPKTGLFGYAEKSEFWALVWGTGIMVVTGAVLWFPKALPAGAPTWVLDVARTIHFFEALLAVLSILVWHFWHTIFHPSEYPMDTSWLTGVIARDEAAHRFDDDAIARMEGRPEKPREATTEDQRPEPEAKGSR